MPARRTPAEFSLSFLDVICCGFGAVILLLMITKSVQPQVIEQAMVDAESAVSELTEQLFEIRGETTILNRDLNVKREQISDYEEKIAILQGTLARTRSEYDALSTSQNANAIIREQLAIARQQLSEEELRLLGRNAEKKNQLIGGIPVDSEYIIFIIDTSGSMRSDWLNVLSKVEQILISYPTLKGIQIMDADGDLLFPYQGLVWNKANLQNRQEILSALARWPEQSLSNPEKGIKKAITNFYSPDKKIAIWIFADDYQGERTVDSLIKFVDNINAVTRDGKRLVTINAIGFRTGFESSRMRFALAMRELCERNGGAFIGL